MHLTATTQFGLEDVLAEELRQFGATIEHVGSRAIEFDGYGFNRTIFPFRATTTTLFFCRLNSSIRS